MENQRPSPSYHTASSPKPTLHFHDKPHHQEQRAPSFSPSDAGDRAQNDDTELGIFGAERYLNDINCSIDRTVSLKQRHSSASSVDRGYSRSYRHGFAPTPAAASEASYNSRTGLLSKPPTLPSKGNASAGRHYRRFHRVCPCASKKSLEVEDKSIIKHKGPACTIADTKNSSCIKKPSMPMPMPGMHAEEMIKVRVAPGSWPKDEDFIKTASLLSPKLPPFALEISKRAQISAKPCILPHEFPSNPPLKTSNCAEEQPRHSLEVFGETAKTVHSRKSSVAAGDNDRASDASSDLFELESFSVCSAPFYSAVDEALDGSHVVQSGMTRWHGNGMKVTGSGIDCVQVKGNTGKLKL